jgi:16S rRNA (cytosine967-C5)-methyltransferase
MDQAAQMAVLALDVPNPKMILDICAAPGGKTALLAHRFPQATIIAIELNGKRIPRLQENLTRLGCRNVSVVQASALSLPFLEGCVDAIFLDAPCSASGILRRHPDAKFLQHQEALNGLVETQKHALASAMHVLKQSRTLVYAVCSIHPQENECIVDTWQPSISIRLFPSDTHDGFFFSRIEKAKRENNV